MKTAESKKQITTREDLDRNMSQWQLLMRYAQIEKDSEFTVNGAHVRVTDFSYSYDICRVTLVNGEAVSITWEKEFPYDKRTKRS